MTRLLSIMGLCSILCGYAAAGEQFPFILHEMKGRPGKLLHKAAYGKDGRLGFLHDVDRDGLDEFVYMAKENNRLGFDILSLETDRSLAHLDLGQGHPAGLAAVQIDDDERSEYVVVYGSRKGALIKKTLTGIFSAIVSVGVALETGWVVTKSPYGAEVDVFEIVGIDDDGKQLWRRSIREEIERGEGWGNTRFQSILPNDGHASATILLTDDAKNELVGLSGKDGSTLWTRKLKGSSRPSKRFVGTLVDDGVQMPALFGRGTMLILHPDTGEAILDGETDKGVGQLPSWQVYGEGDDRGFLAFGEDRFVDLDGDGWLDVPAAPGSSTGHWLSGKDGSILIKGGVAVGNPLVGDWNKDGVRELFWYKKWYEIEKRVPKKGKKNKKG